MEHGMSLWAPPPEAENRAKTPFCGNRVQDSTARCDLYREHKGPHRDSHSHHAWEAHMTAIAGDDTGIWAVCLCGWEHEVDGLAAGRIAAIEHEEAWES